MNVLGFLFEEPNDETIVVPTLPTISWVLPTELAATEPATISATMQRVGGDTTQAIRVNWEKVGFVRPADVSAYADTGGTNFAAGVMTRAFDVEATSVAATRAVTCRILPGTGYIVGSPSEFIATIRDGATGVTSGFWTDLERRPRPTTPPTGFGEWYKGLAYSGGRGGSYEKNIGYLEAIQDNSQPDGALVEADQVNTYGKGKMTWEMIAGGTIHDTAGKTAAQIQALVSVNESPTIGTYTFKKASTCDWRSAAGVSDFADIDQTKILVILRPRQVPYNDTYTATVGGKKGLSILGYTQIANDAVVTGTRKASDVFRCMGARWKKNADFYGIQPKRLLVEWCREGSLERDNGIGDWSPVASAFVTWRSAQAKLVQWFNEGFGPVTPQHAYCIARRNAARTPNGDVREFWVPNTWTYFQVTSHIGADEVDYRIKTMTSPGNSGNDYNAAYLVAKNFIENDYMDGTVSGCHSYNDAIQKAIDNRVPFAINESGPSYTPDNVSHFPDWCMKFHLQMWQKIHDRMSAAGLAFIQCSHNGQSNTDRNFCALPAATAPADDWAAILDARPTWYLPKGGSETDVQWKTRLRNAWIDRFQAGFDLCKAVRGGNKAP